MFTGLVEEVGRVSRIEERPAGRRLAIAARRVLEGTESGDSLALDGCCLTVIRLEPDGFMVEAVPETLARTTIGTWEVGRTVNLERALRLDRRLGGHLVQGHVDGVGRVLRVEPEGEGRRLEIEIPVPLRRFVAEKGSLTVDGVSLTVACGGAGSCQIAYIPHTLEATTAGHYTAGCRVHLEVDLIARYVARILDETGLSRSAS